MSVVLICSLAVNGILLLMHLLRGEDGAAMDRLQLVTDLARAHLDCQERDDRFRRTLRADREGGRARWDAAFRGAWRERVEGWRAEAEGQGLTWLIPFERRA